MAGCTVSDFLQRELFLGNRSAVVAQCWRFYSLRHLWSVRQPIGSSELATNLSKLRLKTGYLFRNFSVKIRPFLATCLKIRTFLANFSHKTRTFWQILVIKLNHLWQILVLKSKVIFAKFTYKITPFLANCSNKIRHFWQFLVLKPELFKLNS